MNFLVDNVLRQIILFSCIPLGAAAGVGFVISLLEGILQVQEQTTIYCVKLIVLIGLLWFFGPSVLQYLTRMFQLSFSTLVYIGSE